MSDEAAAPEAAPEAPAVSESPEAAAEAPAVPDVDGIKADYEAKLAKALNAAQEHERTAWETKQQAEATSKELAELKALKDAIAKDPLKALETSGYTYEQLTNEIIEGKHEPATPEQARLSEQQKQIEALKSELEGFQGQYQSAQEQAQFRSDVGVVRATAEAEEFAALREIAGDQDYEQITTALREEVKAGKTVDVHARLAEVQQTALQNVARTLRSKQALRRILEDSELRELVTAALQPSDENSETDTAQPVNEGGSTRNKPRAVTNNVASKPGSKRGRGSLSEAELRANAIQKAKELFQRNRSA